MSGAPQATPQPRSRAALLAPLRSRDFLLLFGGESTSVLGTQFHLVAMPWLVLRLDGSGLALGTVFMVAAVPRAIFMLFGGALSDHFSPRTLMVLSNLLRGLLMTGLAALLVSGVVKLWMVYLFAFLYGAADAFFYPVFTAVIPLLLDSERLAAGNALLQGSAQLYGLIGPALAGLLVAGVGIAPAFGIDAASFFIAATLLLLIRGGTRVLQQQRNPAAVLGSIREGVAYAWRDPLMRALLYITASLNFAFIGPFMVGTAKLAEQRFPGGAAALGVMLSGFGGGALLGSLTSGSLRRVRHSGWVIIVAILCFAAGLEGIGRAPKLWMVAAVLAVIGFGAGFVNVLAVTWLQKRTEPQMLGRVMSLVMLNSVGLTPFSFLAAGALVEVGIRPMFHFAAAFMLAIAMGAASNRAVREFDSA